MLAGEAVFLFDVDNTLLDNDRFSAELDARLEKTLGAAGRSRYRAIYEALRDELGYADYLGALQKLRFELPEDPDLLQMSEFMLEYPFASRLYPRALDAIKYVGTFGLRVVLSDGDIVFQPRKIQRSGIWNAVEGRVLIYLNKERELEAIQRRFPAPHYVMIEDKPRVLAAMKSALGTKLTTVFVRQGRYAAQSVNEIIDPPPDISIERIADLLDLKQSQFLGGATKERT